MTGTRRLRLVLEGVGLDLGGRPVLDGIDLVVDGGEPVAVTGPSGSGKTLLCLVMAGAMAVSRGSVRVEWPADAGTGPGAAATGHAGPGTSGLVLQTHGLVQGLTAEENVALPLQARGVDRDTAARRCAQALADVGLTRHAGRLVDELSGGERQRVGIARALAVDPAVLVADEPTTELDPGNRERVLYLLTARARAGRIVVIASDDPEIVGACGRVITLERGTVARPPHEARATG